MKVSGANRFNLGARLVIRFLVRLKNKEELTPKQINEIIRRANSRLKEYHASTGNIRVSRRAIEMDLFPPSPRLAPGLAETLEEEFGPILTFRQLDLPTPPPTQSREVIAAARNLFNEERFWETHEEVEALWKTKEGAERELLQGFILVAVAFVHLQKDETEICLSILRRAMKKLEVKLDTYEGLNVRALRENAQEILESGIPELFDV